MSDIQQIKVSTKGAELTSLVANGREYLWQGDPFFWNRHAPILFPIVGRLANDTLRIDGKVFTMKQHGFARDSDFVSLQSSYLYGCLSGFTLLPSNDPIFMQMVHDTPIENYPYDFQLKVRYAINGNTLDVNWEVLNKGKQTMFFQIGAHPAFLLPDYKETDVVHGYLRCYNNQGNTILPVISSRLFDGLRREIEPQILGNKDGLIPIINKTFTNDAILLEGGIAASVGLVDKTGIEILRVNSPQAQVFGIWAPYKKGCPFVCIEPWCGIADREGFIGDISSRDCIQKLNSGQLYTFDYTITVKA